jgi:hypothetical protein
MAPESYRCGEDQGWSSQADIQDGDSRAMEKDEELKQR